MTEEQKKQLVDAGVDLAGVMERFMNNETLLERFMRKFKDDPSYRELCEAVSQKDNDRAFSASHTLKGVAGNLGLIDLYRMSSEQCECFRAGDFAAGEEKMQSVTKEYERVVAGITVVYP